MTELERLAERVAPPYSADEPTMLGSWLDFHRATLAWKCTGLSDSQLRQRAVPPSSMSLLGLIRHMAEVERYWFQRVLLGSGVEALYWNDANPDGDFDDVDEADTAVDVRLYDEACQAARAATSAAESLDVIAVGARAGDLVSLRWIMVHMIEEYARHNGHADLLRERIDGSTGD